MSILLGYIHFTPQSRDVLMIFMFLFAILSQIILLEFIMLLPRFIILLFLLIPATFLSAMPVQNYLPKQATFNDKIPLPSDSLGFEIGQRHVRHDQLKQYFSQLSDSSTRLKMTAIGKTAQLRDQFLITISSPENIENLDTILASKRSEKANTKTTDEPLVVWLGYSVHGDEISGANAAMVVAYYLAASEEQYISTMLANTIIVLEPSVNPDGMDRFVNWVSTYRGSASNSDAEHIEHHQGWVSGRTNHFWFDLNRDWLLLTQQESRHRLKYFHQYQPHVLGDYHEMGANSSYFFQPGIISRTHPLTPKQNVSLTQALAKFHASALDKAQRLYYSQESFDDFYYGKGSTYPDINASVGILFEQASSRGMQQDTINGLLTFEFGIQNHVLTSLSTIEGAWQNRQALQKYQQSFYQQAIKQAKKEKFKGYLISETKDSYRLNTLLEKLTQHQIQVYPLSRDFSHQGKSYNAQTSYYIPLAQKQYRLVQALFNQQTDFPDNTFYDVSGWTMPLAMNIEFHQLDSTWGLEIAKTPWSTKEINHVSKLSVKNSDYAYAFEWHHALAPKLLNQLLAKKINAKVATSSFTSEVNGKKRSFASGTIIIPAGVQTAENWRVNTAQLAHQVNIELVTINSGLTRQGIDFGSNSFRLLKQPKVLLLGGKGISQYEAGEIRYYLDETLHIPVSVVEHSRLSSIDLSNYSHLILVDGNYQGLSAKNTSAVKAWLKQGGIVFAQKRGAKWLAKQDILAANFASKKEINLLFDTDKLSYGDKEKLSARKRIAGAIFETKLDTSHPLAFGYTQENLPIFRNSTLIMDAGQQPFITVAKYHEDPLLSGYTDSNLVRRLAHNAAIVAHNYGKGRVIATADVLAFRGYWLGSAKLLANSLFFAKAFNAQSKR
ncbi:M14 family zinc carboxypeptidase [Colwellia sp. KU-HH00111]|uniref:M14 family zinc carboxypeptidase n=1 Tax=Colwellia sp. KU-HH00111 TaxID=3127652 RepID=UPI003365458D